MNFKITLFLFLCCYTMGFSQSQFINPEFGNYTGVACLNIPGETSTMGDLIKINNTFYGLTSFGAHNIVKLNENGDLVTSFGNNGYITLDLGTSVSGLYDPTDSFIRVTPDNNLLIIASPSGLEGHHFMTKTDLNGSIITSFGENGYVDYLAPYYIDWISNEITDNEIILVGRSLYSNSEEPTSQSNIIVMKYDLDGNPITSFGTNGVATYSMDISTLIKDAHYYPESNKILFLAEVLTDESAYSFVAKVDLNTDSVDTTFGTNGYIYYQDEGGVVTRPDRLYVYNNNIFVAGWTGISFNESSIFIKKLLSGGELYTAFGNQGTFLYTVENADSQNVSNLVFNNGKILITGYITPTNTSSNNLFLLRINDNSQLDASFGNNGFILNSQYLAVYFSAYKTIVENENRITVATLSTSCSDASGNGIPQPKPAVVQFIAGTLSSEAVVKDTALSYYPNPVKDILYISTPNMIKAEVYDVTGKLLNTVGNSVINTVDFSGLQAGLYLVKIYTEDKSQNIKVIKE